ncbi:MAG: hypothetical protein RLZZ416_271 [Candidatus Parcubacteria bacterium]|jgi:hypothetical protein
MMQSLLHNKILLIVIALLVAGGAWYGLSSSSAPEPALVTSAPSGGVTSKSEQELVSTLLALRAVKLDGGIFGDPSFLSLKDFSTEIVQEPVGRPNPFAPLETRMASPNPDQAAESNNKKTDQIFTPRR